MIKDRDPLGRIAADPASPFAEFKQPHRERDGRSDPYLSRRSSEPSICVRLPRRVLQALKLLAEQRRVSLSTVVRQALVPILQPVLRDGEPRLHDPPLDAASLALRNVRLPQRHPNPLGGGIPAYDHVGRQAQRVARKSRPGTLIDR